MKQRSGFSPRDRVDTTGCSAVGQAGGVLLSETVRARGLVRAGRFGPDGVGTLDALAADAGGP